MNLNCLDFPVIILDIRSPLNAAMTQCMTVAIPLSLREENLDDLPSQVATLHIVGSGSH
jgi:hypothetical protein